MASSGPEPDNPYVAYNPGYSGDSDQNVIEDELCGIAQIDAWHDHHNITGLTDDAIKNGVNMYTNKQCDKPATNEDNFMFQKITNNKQYNKYCRVPSNIVLEVSGNILKKVQINNNVVDTVYEFNNIETLNSIFTPMVSSRYNVLYCENVETNYSKIQAALNSQGIFDDYFLIKDTAKSNYPDDLKKTGNDIKGQPVKNQNQKVTSLLTAQGIYDPGPTTTPYTPSGAEYGFKDANTKSKFGIIDFGNRIESITTYPKWVGGETYVKYHPFERLLYSKYDSKMVASTDGPETNVKKYITETNSTFYINDNNNVFYVNKTNSDKATDLAELALSEKFEKIGSHRFPPGTQFPFPKATNIITRSGGKKYFSKKVGDDSQLTKTLCPIIYYKELNVVDGVETLQNKETNGIHGFVSFDRVAIETSLFHGSPIVIFITDNGFVIYISKNLINKLSSPATKYEKIYKEFETKKQKITEMYNEYQPVNALINKLRELETELEGKKTSLIDFLNNVNNNFKEKVNAIAVARGRSSVKSDSYDREYKLWLSKLYIYNQLGNAFGNLKKSDVLSGDSLENLFSYAIAIETISDSLNIKVDYADYNKRKEIEEERYTDDEFDTNINTINTQIVTLDEIVKKFIILNNYLDEIKLINNIYTEITKYNFETILALNTNVNDEKLMNKYLKEQNPQIADSISLANISAGFQNPGCISSLFSCFGSSKMPHFGPIHEICKYYQYIQNTIIDSYQNFLIKIKTISNLSLYDKQLTYLSDKITKDGSDSNDSDEHILNLSDETRTNISGCYNAAIQGLQVGGERPSKTIKIEDYNLQEYLEFNSFVCILQFYLSVVQMNFNIQIIDQMITHCLENGFIYKFIDEKGEEYIIGCNEMINNEILKKLSIETFTDLQKDLYRITNLYINNTFNEITSYNLFVNNIVGLFNIKLFKLIILTLIKNNVYTSDVINKRKRNDDNNDIKLTYFVKEEIQIQINEMVNYINRNEQNAYKNYYSFISFKTNIIDVIENHPERSELNKQIEVLNEITKIRKIKINRLIKTLFSKNETIKDRNSSIILNLIINIINNINNINNINPISNSKINNINNINNTSDINDIFIDYFNQYINSDQLPQQLLQVPPQQLPQVPPQVRPQVPPQVPTTAFDWTQQQRNKAPIKIGNRPPKRQIGVTGGNSKKNRRTKKKTSKTNKKNTRKVHPKKSNKRTKRKPSK
jgi:hypothetical protein